MNMHGTTTVLAVATVLGGTCFDPSPPPPTQGVHSAFLHLSGLKEGGYQFRLTVTDTKGQIDSVQVSVVVKAGWLVCW